MRLLLIAVGGRVPSWVAEGYAEYARRLPAESSLELVEVAAGRRGKNSDLRRIVADEGARMIAAVPRGARIVALDERGLQWSTVELATEMQRWRNDGEDVALLIGGPDGLAPDCRARAHRLWSLSSLTLPHALVRVIVAEQLYRAWSLVVGHPYHRD
jgi:23S rRNA (pseudouridine1915-N3)-methyltransferase